MRGTRSLLAILALAGLFVPAGIAAAADEDKGPTEDREMTVWEFHEWDFYNTQGWVAVGKDDYVNAAKRFKTAIGFARIGSRKDPRLLARSYADMAYCLHKQGRSTEAEPMARWALEVRETGPRIRPEALAQNLYTVAMIEIDLAKFSDAEIHLIRAVDRYGKAYGEKSAKLVPYLNDLAYFYMTQRKYAKAEPLYQRCLEMPEKELPVSDAGRITSLFGMGNVCMFQGLDDRAERYYKKALEQFEFREPNARLHADLLENYAALMRHTGRSDEADKLQSEATTLRTTKPVSARITRATRPPAP